MKILIIEDEKHNASRLHRLLSEISPDHQVLDILESVQDSVNWLKQKIYVDVILMDIRLSDGLSFDIFELVEVVSPVIFTTSYDEYALRAFKVNSIDYLLKPIEKEELDAALKKVEKEKMAIFTSLELEKMLNQLRDRSPVFRKRFLLPEYDGYSTVTVDKIEYIFTEQKVTYLVTNYGSVDILSLTMDELEDELDPSEFFRVNRQYIIHINSVSKVLNGDNGKLKVILRHNCPVEIFVSREKAPLFKKWLDK